MAICDLSLVASFSTGLRFLAGLGHVLDDEVENDVRLHTVHCCHLMASFFQYLVRESGVLGLLEQDLLLHSKEVFA